MHWSCEICAPRTTRKSLGWIIISGAISPYISLPSLTFTWINALFSSLPNCVLIARARYDFWSDSSALKIINWFFNVSAYLISNFSGCSSSCHVTDGNGTLSIGGRSNMAGWPDSTDTCRSVMSSKFPMSTHNRKSSQNCREKKSGRKREQMANKRKECVINKLLHLISGSCVRSIKFGWMAKNVWKEFYWFLACNGFSLGCFFVSRFFFSQVFLRNLFERVTIWTSWWCTYMRRSHQFFRWISFQHRSVPYIDKSRHLHVSYLVCDSIDRSRNRSLEPRLWAIDTWAADNLICFWCGKIEQTSPN